MPASQTASKPTRGAERETTLSAIYLYETLAAALDEIHHPGACRHRGFDICERIEAALARLGPLGQRESDRALCGEG